MAKNNGEMTVIYPGDEKSEPERRQASGSAPNAKLICLNASEIADLPDDYEVELLGDTESVIGRGKTCSICIVSRKLSREHARIFPGIGKWGVEDLNSTNGVNVNGQRVTSAWLNSGDEIGFGPILFRFELEKPDIAAAVPGPAPDPGEQPAAEMTMIVGSDAASEAVLDAVREVEAEAKGEPAEVAETRAEPLTSRRAARPAVSKAAAIKWTISIAVLIAAVAGGLYFYPQYQRGQEIERTVASGKRFVTDIVSLGREKTSVEIFDANYENELIMLTEYSVEVERELAKDPGNAPLTALLARLLFMEYEREVIGDFKNAGFDSAKALTRRYATRFQELGDNASTEVEDVRDGAELLKYSDILLDFRAFAAEFPTVGVDAPRKPPAERLSALGERKTIAIRYRRAHNRPLSVYYLVFKNIVDDVDSRDIALFNDWRNFLKKKP